FGIGFEPLAAHCLPLPLEHDQRAGARFSATYLQLQSVPTRLRQCQPREVKPVLGNPRDVEGSNRASLGQQCVAAGRKQRERALASNLLARQTDEHGGFRDHERQCLFTPDDVRHAGNVHQPAAVPHRPTRDQCDVQALHITLASSCRRLGSLNLSSSSAVMSTLLALPSSISSAVTIPAAGACISPWPEKPAQTYAPSRCPSLSISGW